MQLSRIFDVAKDIIDQVKSIIDSDSFSNDLGRAGGLISLVGIALKIYQDVREENYTDEQKAFKSLLGFVFESARDLLKDVEQKEQEKVNQQGFSDKISTRHILEENRKKLKEKLLDPFMKNHKWNSYLPDHPSIVEFRINVMTYLKGAYNFKSSQLDNFIIQFNLKIEAKASRDEEITKFYSWWTAQDQLSDLLDYLENVKTNQGFITDWDKIPLQKYYVKNNAVLVPPTTWNLDDTDMDTIECNPDNIISMINNFLSKDDRYNWYLIIGGSFGIGKSTLCKFLASYYAQSFLTSFTLAQILNTKKDDNKSSTYEIKAAGSPLAVSFDSEGSRPVREDIKPDPKRYIPIFTSLRTNLDDYIYKKERLEEVLKKIVSPGDNKQYQFRNILLILDGLDEYPEEIDGLMELLHKYHDTYQNMKVIIYKSTRS